MLQRRTVLFLVVLAASGCTHAELPWPKSAGTVPVEDWHDDGGQSIAPTATDHSSPAVTTAESVDDDEIEIAMPETSKPK
jgi:hypothetical protein